MGSLVPFDPKTTTFLLALPFNFLALTQGNDGLSVTASSSAAGTDASMMLDDNHAQAWRSDGLGATQILEWDMGVPTLIDTFALAGNNLRPANGKRVEMWDDVVDSGIKVVDSGAGIDCVVREDSDFIEEDQDLRLVDRLNISPFRFSAAMVRGIRVTIDTSGGNGPDSFVEVAFPYAGLSLDVLDCLSANGVTFEPLTPTTTSVGLGGSWTPRFPGRKNDIPLSFLDSGDSADVNRWIGSRKLGLKSLFWPTPNDLPSFTASAFFGTIQASGKSQRISNTIAQVNVEIVEQR